MAGIPFLAFLRAPVQLPRPVAGLLDPWSWLTPKNQLAPRMPKTGYIQEIRGPLLIKGINPSAKHEKWRKGSKSPRKTQVFGVLVRQLAEGGPRAESASSPCRRLAGSLVRSSRWTVGKRAFQRMGVHNSLEYRCLHRHGPSGGPLERVRGGLGIHCSTAQALERWMGLS
jgi:hypothetical protein